MTQKGDDSSKDIFTEFSATWYEGGPLRLYVCSKLVKETDKEENLYNVILYIIIAIMTLLC